MFSIVPSTGQCCSIMRRKQLRTALSRRKRLLSILVTCLTAVALVRAWGLSGAASGALRPAPPPAHDLGYLRRDRNLKHYLDDIQLLIQPSVSRCDGVEELPLLVLVASSPAHVEQRAVIRRTWGRHLPTYFVLGLAESDRDELLMENYLEAKQHSDLVVFEFTDSYHNLTLKTALMLQWTLHRCPLAGALMKTDDDVLINPWTLKEVMRRSEDLQLIGYKMNNSLAHREEYTKWHLPRWLFPTDLIPEYLSGTGYIIAGDYIEKIFKAAHRVPLLNLEDVYFTHNVAKKGLGLTLTHDRRLSPYRPWVPGPLAACAFWGLATAHSLTPEEIEYTWTLIVELAERAKAGDIVCSYLSFLSNDLFLY